MRKVNADYASMWIPSKTGKAQPSAQELVHAVEKMEAQLSDDAFFQNARQMGTPDDDYSCFPVSESGASSGHSLSYELPSNEEEKEEANDLEVIAQPLQFEPQQYNNLPSPHLGSTQMDDPADFVDEPPMEEVVPFVAAIPVEEATIRPDKKRGNDEYIGNNPKGTRGPSGGKHQTMRKRRTSLQVFIKRKTRKQRKRKTRKIYKKTYNKKNI